MLISAQTPKEADMDLRERLGLRLKARSLDRALAAGASPDGDQELARRARALVRADTRNEVAVALYRLADGDERGPLRRDVERVATRLLDPGPVAPRGVALAFELLSDGPGTSSWAESDQDLRPRLNEVLEALEPGTSDPKPETEGSPR
jgi:hypothetical protein